MLAEIIEPIVRSLQSGRPSAPSGPQEAEIRRAGTGAGMIALGLAPFVAITLQAPQSSPIFVLFLAHEAAINQLAWYFTLAWAALICNGILLFMAGSKRSRGPRDMIVAAKASAWIALLVALCWQSVFVPDAPWLNLCLGALYIWLFASNLTKLALAVRGMPAQTLPPPEDMPDFPMSGPASREEAEQGMADKSDWTPPKFKG